MSGSRGGFGYAVEGVGFSVEVGGAGVEVLGCLRVGVSGQFAAGEPDHVTGQGPDREHDPAPEHVVGPAVFAADVGHAGLDRCLVVAESVAQAPVLGGRPPEVPPFPVVGGDAPPGEVAAGFVGGGVADELVVVPVGAAGEYPSAGVVTAGFGRLGVGGPREQDGWQGVGEPCGGCPLFDSCGPGWDGRWLGGRCCGPGDHLGGAAGCGVPDGGESGGGGSVVEPAGDGLIPVGPVGVGGVCCSGGELRVELGAGGVEGFEGDAPPLRPPCS